jgi:hypothetical protein
LLQCNQPEPGMMDDLQRGRGEEGTDRQTGSWPVVVSSWALVLLFFFLLAGISAVACPRHVSHPHRHLAGVVIPQHDACSGPGLASAPGIDGCETVPFGQDRFAYW